MNKAEAAHLSNQHCPECRDAQATWSRLAVATGSKHDRYSPSTGRPGGQHLGNGPNATPRTLFLNRRNKYNF
jgi:hypothetical protein